MPYVSVGEDSHRIYYKIRGDSDAPIKIVRGFDWSFRAKTRSTVNNKQNQLPQKTGIHNGIGW